MSPGASAGVERALTNIVASLRPTRCTAANRSTRRVARFTGDGILSADLLELRLHPTATPEPEPPRGRQLAHVPHAVEGAGRVLHVAGRAGAGAAVDDVAVFHDVAVLLEGRDRAQRRASVPSDRPLHRREVGDDAHRVQRERALVAHDHNVAQRLVHRDRDKEPKDGRVGARRELVGVYRERADARGVAVER